MFKFFRKFSFYFALAILNLIVSGCSLYRLDVQNQYLSRDRLASYHVGTPDPRLLNPVIGQRLVIQWSLTPKELINQDVCLYLKVRLRNRQEQEAALPITTKRGTYLYDVVGDRYIQTGGILTYFVEIRSPSYILASWRHPFWVDPIIFDYSSQTTEEK
jgi:hypothetical protein